MQLNATLPPKCFSLKVTPWEKEAGRGKFAHSPSLNLSVSRFMMQFVDLVKLLVSRCKPSQVKSSKAKPGKAKKRSSPLRRFRSLRPASGERIVAQEGSIASGLKSQVCFKIDLKKKKEKEKKKEGRSPLFPPEPPPAAWRRRSAVVPSCMCYVNKICICEFHGQSREQRKSPF